MLLFPKKVYICVSLNIKTTTTIMKTTATVKTKSNFRNLNGQSLEVVEIAGTRVSCKVFCNEMQKVITVDFSLKEIVKFSNY